MEANVIDNLPVSFIQNQGQLEDERVHFYTRGKDCTVFFTQEGASFVFVKNEIKEQILPEDKMTKTIPKEQKGFRLDFRFLNGGRKITPMARGELEGNVNEFRGSDPTKWRSNISTFTDVVYRNVWPGIDLIFRGSEGQIKYEFMVQPGANINDIRFTYNGADELSLDSHGALCIDMPFGVLMDKRPVSYQEDHGGQFHVESAFQLMTRGKGVDEITFKLKEGYDHQSPLIIDPGLNYSTYLGGSNFDDGTGIAVDSDGNAYLVGSTSSLNFPTTVGAFDTNFNGALDVFVTKLNSSGSSLIYSTYLGGITGANDGIGISVDGSGNAYITGYTSSMNFPTTPGAFDTTFNGVIDAFVTKLNASGSGLVYSTYLGGDGEDYGFGIEVDGLGNAYVTGFTSSGNFPTTPGSFNPTYSGGSDAFVTKLNVDGSALVYSTYLGGAGSDRGYGIAVDSMANAYITGYTSSVNFPTTPGAFDLTYNGGFDGFVTKLDTSGSVLVYSTYLGGVNFDQGLGIEVDGLGNAYVTGSTSSGDFPSTPGAFDTTFNGSIDAFVTKLNASGSGLIYSTYLGGTGEDVGFGIAVDGLGYAYVTGSTSSGNFPTTPGAFDPSYNGNTDAFVTMLNPTGSALAFSSYLGGASNDQGLHIAVDNTGNAYIIGFTSSGDFPVTPGAFDITYNGNTDAFITKMGLICPEDITVNNNPGQCGAIVNYTSPPGATCNPPSGSFFPVGDTIITCTENNQACTFQITVNDTEPPTITCPGDITQDNDPGQCGAVVTFPDPVVMDNCPGATLACIPPSGSFFPIGTTEVECVATDASGNESEPCTFEIMVNDTEPPTITCPGDITQDNDPGQCGAVVTFPDPVVMDNCPGATLVCIPPSGSFSL
ncbi:HYR domain-containing protein [Halobacillus litoralis]|uniref:HYR domain-containing protein n=1 Tax=Halobacillus litoralis TaxID=45668 RepID=A0A845DZ96_9BACI|nr:SBBP repeat-containing protein [Halobacillus litoralis]MYL21642.1 HYR domain-containing protein [Halobacillus litoralis]